MPDLEQLDGQLEICSLCDGSPHALGCPFHEHYDDDHYSFANADEPTDVGTAKFWVEDTFAVAAMNEGIDSVAALREGIIEFNRAVKEDWIKKV